MTEQLILMFIAGSMFGFTVHTLMNIIIENKKK